VFVYRTVFVSIDQNADVTVVGAGPVGLMLAAELALAGASVQVLERLAEPDPVVKAQAVNVPTAEALDRRGLGPAAEAVHREMLARQGSPAGHGRPDPRFTGHFAGVVLDPDLVDWADPELAAHTAGAGARMVPQPALVALLAEHVARLGVPVHRGVEVTGLELAGPGGAGPGGAGPGGAGMGGTGPGGAGDGVRLETSAGPVRTGWVVGCDGGHSAVRRLAGIGFPGTDPELTGLQAVVDLADPEKLADGWVWSAGGVYRQGPQPGRVAIVEFDGGPADRAARSAPVTREEVQERLRRVSGTDVTVTALRGGASRWTDNTRQAAHYRLGRVLLAGDSAHVHPPFGGQGLNLGVGDAMNLGWKLGAVIAGWAPERLLDSYEVERRPLGAWVLDWSRAQVAMLRGDARSGALRNIVIDLLGTRDGVTWAVTQLSGVTQRIDLPGEHPLTGRHLPDLWLRDGSRLADHGHGGGFLLLDRTPDGALTRLAAPWSARVMAVADGPVDEAPAGVRAEVPAGVPAEVLVGVPAGVAVAGALVGVLVRPDGVVAWATDTADTTGLADALHQWAGTPADAPLPDPPDLSLAIPATGGSCRSK
jgi:2-polyprenyl-6-methoxyphenol hydroxylase-like FAD-dependent oxidoreductase